MARGQEPLRPSVPGQHILDAVPGGCGNDERAAAGQALAGRPPTSVNWDGGIVYSCTKSGTKYPDFLISSYYGLKEPGGQELEREVPHLVVEVGSLHPNEVIPTIDDQIAILKQLQSYMARVVAHVDLTKHELPWGLAIIGTYAAWLRPSRRNTQCAWEYIGGFHSGRGYWTSIYGLEFRKQWCVSHGSITVQSIMTDTGKAYDHIRGVAKDQLQLVATSLLTSPFNLPNPGRLQLDWNCFRVQLILGHEAQAAAQSSGAPGSTAAEDRMLLKSMQCMAALMTGFQCLSNEDTLMVLGLTDAMSRFWEVLDGPEGSGAAALEHLRDTVVLKDVPMEHDRIQGAPGVPQMTRQHGGDGEMRDTFDAETTRVEAVNKLLDTEITREENMHMLLERRHIGEEEDGIAHYINQLNLRLLPPMVMPIPDSPPGQYKQLENGEYTKVLNPGEKLQYLDDIIEAQVAQYAIMDEYISAEIRFWESVLEGSEREQRDWYARDALHPVMEDSDYFVRGFTEFCGLEDMHKE
ncbi:uncharacterized protein B0H18DRAFT_958815 [Fomitopsis serialis]|uniref:uncharacterized protein n=1 Tax=Fomitopsis serialis TaxID=139415 RepID=UPI002008C46C|nr:uncharacterized protein B0H18DRAFT_958815 [Neoantrodia serialis]KAH9916459.1 hypothetical protein B0H18DRAFT_958815 [Neoantrodia serialis]